MRLFVFKVLLLIMPILLLNGIVGLFRYFYGDPTLIYNQIEKKKYFNSRQETNLIGYNFIDSAKFDMSGELWGSKIIKHFDKFGFSNKLTGTDPSILFIGDSFFDDPFVSWSEGLSWMVDKSMNISSMGNSGFLVYNEMFKNGVFHSHPKIIFLEVVERNLNAWAGLREQLEFNKTKTTGFKFPALSFVFGNNFPDLSFLFKSKATQKKATQKYGVYNLGGTKPVMFYKNKLSSYSDKDIEVIINNLVFVNRWFEKRDCKIFFLIAPDKESLFPEVFGTSKLEYIQGKMSEKGLKIIDIYNEFIRSENRLVLYHAGDTHWSPIGFEKVKEKIRKITGIQ